MQRGSAVRLKCRAERVNADEHRNTGGSAIAVAALLAGGRGSDDGDAAAAAPEATATARGTTRSPAEAGTFTSEDAVAVVGAIHQADNTYDFVLFVAASADDLGFVDERGTADGSTQGTYFGGLRDSRHQVSAIGDPVVIGEDPFVVVLDPVNSGRLPPPEGVKERAPTRSSSTTACLRSRGTRVRLVSCASSSEPSGRRCTGGGCVR